MKSSTLLLLAFIIMSIQTQAQSIINPFEAIQKQKLDDFKNGQHSNTDDQGSVLNYIPQRLLNPSHKLDSAIYTYALGDTVMNELGKIIYTFDQNQQLTEYVVSNYDSSYNQGWGDVYKRSFTYNTDGQLTSWRQSTWITIWVQTKGEDFIFNNQDSLIEYIYYELSASNVLMKKNKTEYLYDTTGYRFSEIGYIWNQGQQQWDKSRKTLIFYNLMHKLNKTESYTWNSATNIWHPLRRFQYQYNNLDLMSEKIESMGNTINNPWYDYFKTTYTYNSLPKVDSVFYSKKDSIGGPWISMSAGAYNYDNNGNNTLLVYFTIDTIGNLVYNAKFNNSYNTNNLLVLHQYQTYNVQSTLWENNSKISYQYDSGNNLIMNRIYNWDATNQTWDSFILSTSDFDLSLSNQDIVIPRNPYVFTGTINEFSFNALMEQSNNALKHFSAYRKNYNSNVYYKENSYTFYYSTLTASIENNDNQSFFKVFPNPASSIVNIELTELSKEQSYIEIFDVQGRIIKEISLAKNQRKVRIDVSELESGLYFIKYSDKNTTYGSKLMVE